MQTSPTQSPAHPWPHAYLCAVPTCPGYLAANVRDFGRCYGLTRCETHRSPWRRGLAVCQAANAEDAARAMVLRVAAATEPGNRCDRCGDRFTSLDERAEVTQLPYGTHPSLVIHQACMTDQDVVA